MSDSAIPRTVAHQAPLLMGFSRQEYWSGLPFPSPGDLPNLGMEPRSPTLQADALASKPPRKPSVVGLYKCYIYQLEALSQDYRKNSRMIGSKIEVQDFRD